MIGTRRAGIRYLGAVVASVVALSLYAPLSTASAAVSATCTCTITLNPTSGPRGTSVTVTGSGFTANATVTIQFVDAASARTVFASATTNNQGAFSKAVVIPAAAALGHGNVVANTGALKAKAGFLVTKSCSTTARITLSPTAGQRNSTVNVSGTGFCPTTRVRVRFRDNNLTWTTLAMSVPVGSGGNFAASGTIPSNAALGAGSVSAYAAASDQRAKAPFTVQP